MTFKQLVIRNVTRNGRAYGTYFFSSLFSVMIFYIAALIQFHPALQEIKASSDTMSFLAGVGLVASQMVIVLISFVFLWYAYSIFLKGRKRDFSIYLILGMDERKLKRMVLAENSLLAASAIISGIALGTLFSKVIFLVAQNMLALEEGMPLYAPWQPILVTVLIYGLLFFILVFVTSFSLQLEALSEMTKSEQKPLPEPRSSWLLSLLGLVLLAAGYGAVILFAGGVARGSGRTYFFGQPLALLMGVLLTIGGTYLFFQQNTISYFHFLKRQPSYFKKGRMLSVSNLIYRLKQNGMLYFMLANVAAVALVAIGVTRAIGSESFARSQAVSYAFVINGSEIPAHRELEQELVGLIKEAGYQPYTSELQPLWLNYSGGENMIAVIPASKYNELAAVSGQQVLEPANDEVILFAQTNSEVNFIKSDKLDREFVPTQLILDNGQPMPGDFRYRYTQQQLLVMVQGISLVSDETYQQILSAQKKAHQVAFQQELSLTTDYIIHYQEWSTDRALARQLEGLLAQKKLENEETITAHFAKTETEDNEELSEEEQLERNSLLKQQFFYESLYRVWLQTKQSNGMILMLTVLIGTVFFSFAALILYFRLFGELEKDGDYHRSLHILGATRQFRHRLVTREMIMMYLLPLLMAYCHFAVAMYAFSRLIDLPLMTYFLTICGIFLLFQCVFLLVSRWNYLRHLDRLAERTL